MQRHSIPSAMLQHAMKSRLTYQNAVYLLNLKPRHVKIWVI